MPRRTKNVLESVNAPLPPVADGPLIRVSLLGGLRVERSGTSPVTRFQTQKTAALLAYLALHPARAHGREFLTDLFWPESAMEGGRRSFRTALSSLRRQLEPPGTPMGTVLIADRVTVRLNMALLETDVARFEAACLAESADTPALEEDRLEAALAWYGGPLLPGFYDDWAEGTRERLADLYRGLLLRRASLAEQRGGLGVALDYARRAILLEQNREASGTEEVSQPAHIAVIRLLARTGRPEEARRQYEVLAERLRAIYDESPSPEARAALALAPDAPEVLPAESRVEDAAGNVAAASAPPPAKPIVRLPVPLTRFFGRGPECDQLAEMFSDAYCRLATLTGPGGSGKTRLALEWAKQWGAAVCFVPLADLTQASYLWAAIAQALALERLTDPGAVRAQVCEALNDLEKSGDSAPLLVLDNFEEWVDAGASLVEHLLKSVPSLRVLVTSRRRLQVDGEREIPVGPLPVPTLPGTPERLLEWASVQLFVNRAQSARPDFQMTPRNAETIAALCQRLDGVPLALELTAAWAGALSPAQILARVNEHLLDEAGPPLAHQRAQRPARHRTLRAALETSVGLLPDDLQNAFARLSVFRGGWTLEAAESVLSEQGSAADRLSRLRERSLLVAESDADGDSLRFRLLPVLREYAEEMLEGDKRRVVQAAHAAYFLRFAEANAPLMTGAEAKAAIDALETEHDNLRAALDYLLTVEKTNTEYALRLAGAMAHFWLLRGYWEEGVGLLDRALDSAAHDEVLLILRARALRGKGKIAYEQAEYAVARRVYEEALEIWRRIGDEVEIANLLHGMATLAHHADSDYERARVLVEECLALRRKLGDRVGIAIAVSGLGTIAGEVGDYEEARQCYEEFLDCARELANREYEANALFSLGNLAYIRAQLDEAKTLIEESLRLQTELGNRQRIGHCWATLGSIATDGGDHATARSAYNEALKIARQIGDNWAVGILLSNLGKLAYNENKLVEAQALCGESLQLRATQKDRAGAARVLESLALIAAAQAETQIRAAVLWGAAHGLREQLGVPIAETLRDEHAEAVAAMRMALGESAFDAAWARGAALTFDEIIGFATQ